MAQIDSKAPGGISDAGIAEGLTFDDVLLIPQHSDVLPTDVVLDTRFSRNVELRSPLASAAMDTVTEWELGVALARTGGIGIIHRNFSIEAQVAQVDKVKRSANGVILDPVTLAPEVTIGEARAVMSTQNISGLPVCSDGKVVGILTSRDCRFEAGDDHTVGEIMTSENLITAPFDTSLEEARELLFKHKVEKLILVDSDDRLQEHGDSCRHQCKLRQIAPTKMHEERNRGKRSPRLNLLRRLRLKARNREAKVTWCRV